jgi:hypothetical protein
VAHREFTDAHGVHWQAWEVIPSTAERRSAGERRFGTRARYDRRVREDLRVRMGEIAHGWLVFECAREKRRLMPVPSGWSEVSEQELRVLCDTAQPASRLTPRITG